MSRPKPLTPAQAHLVHLLVPEQGTSARYEPAIVDGVVPGGAVDHTTKATVAWRGEVGLPMPYVASYIPVVGHVVLLLVQGPQAVILGHIIGQTDA